MNARRLQLASALLGGGLTGSASAMYIDLGTSLVEFDAARFVNFSGSFSIGPDSLTLYPGTSVAVSESGSHVNLDYAGSFPFAAKPGYRITGFTLEGNGNGVDGNWSSASISGSFNAAGNGPWQQSSTLAPLEDISLSGTLGVSSSPMVWNVWEQVGTEWDVIGGHEETTYSYEFVGYDTIHGPILYWTVIGTDGDGDPVYGWQCCTEDIVEVREVWDYVPHTN